MYCCVLSGKSIVAKMIKQVKATFQQVWMNPHGVNMTPIKELMTKVQKLIVNEKHRHNKVLTINASNFVGGSNTSKELVTVDLIAGVPPERCPNYSDIPGFKQVVAAVLSASAYQSISPAIDPNINFISTLQELSFDICNYRHVNSLSMHFNFGYAGDNKNECGCLARLLCGQANVALEESHVNYISQNDQVSVEGRKL